MAACTYCRPPHKPGALQYLRQPPPCTWRSVGQSVWLQKAVDRSFQPCSLGPCTHHWRWLRRFGFSAWPAGLLKAHLLCPWEQSTVHLLHACHICHCLPVQIKTPSVEPDTLSTGSVIWKKPMHSDWVWFRHDKWVSDGFHFEATDLQCDLHISIWWSLCLLLLWPQCCMGSQVFPHKGRSQSPNCWLYKTRAEAHFLVPFSGKRVLLAFFFFYSKLNAVIILNASA